MVSDEREKELLDIHGMHMADSLMVKARELNLDLRPLLDTGYGWFEWLTTTLGEQTRNDVFWNLSHAYAAAVTLPIGNDIDVVYEARRWQVAHRRKDCAFPELYHRLGLIPEDNEFNRRAAAFRELARHCNGAAPIVVYGMKP